MNTNIIAGAVSSVNEGALKNVIARGAGLVSSILELQRQGAVLDQSTVELQDELNKLSTSVIDDVAVIGTALPTTNPNPNQATIAKVLAEMNKAQQDGVAAKASRLAQLILSNQSSRNAINERITKQREELAKLSVDVVTETQVAGTTTAA